MAHVVRALPEDSADRNRIVRLVRELAYALSRGTVEARLPPSCRCEALHVAVLPV